MSAALLSLVGKPYRLGASGPDEYDCVGLLRRVGEELGWAALLPPTPAHDDASLRVVVSLYAAGERDGQRAWVEIPQPRHGCLVLMGRADRSVHAGVWLREEGGLVLHASDPHGVTVDRVMALRATGMQRIKYYWPREGAVA